MCVVVAGTIFAFCSESLSSVEFPWTTSPVLGARIFRTAGLLGRLLEMMLGWVAVGVGEVSPPPLQPTARSATHATAAIHALLGLIRRLRRSSCSGPAGAYRPAPSR